MNLLRRLIESFLIEAVALTKGSQKVLSDKKLVSALAARVRRDADFNPSVFPPGSDKKFDKATDDVVATWFLESIDKIEKDGYEGTRWSRDGLYSDWIVRKYIEGRHNWEDIIGVLNMNMRDWYILNTRNLLDPIHKNIPKFSGVRDLGNVLVHHYSAALAEVRDAAKFAARDKLARNIKVVDNDDYKIFAALNRAAACKLGSGTQWCTANSSSGSLYNSYSGQAMLFQMFPKNPEIVDKISKFSGKQTRGPEKYQFGADTGVSFKDIADDSVNPEMIRTKFPYLYTDILSSLKTNKDRIKTAIEELSADPDLQDADMTKIKSYKIDDEIKKLKVFKDRGYFTDLVRPKEKSDNDDADQEQPQLDAPVASVAPEAPGPEQGHEPIAETKEKDLYGDEYQDKVKSVGQKAKQGPMKTVWDEKTRKYKVVPVNQPKDKKVSEEDETADMDSAQMPPAMGAASGGGSSGGQYPPGTAPTMPESINHQGKNTMENVDKDVAAMLNSLKKYDKLVESVAPVLMGRDKDEVQETVVSEEGNPWETLGAEYHNDSSKSSTGGKITKTDAGVKHSEKPRTAKGKADKGSKESEADKSGEYHVSNDREKTKDSDDLEESVDPEILEWMNRFAKLGNMKGYGR